MHSDEEVRQVFRQVQGEVPGSPIFAMKLAPVSRHLEVGARQAVGVWEACGREDGVHCLTATLVAGCVGGV